VSALRAWLIVGGSLTGGYHHRQRVYQPFGLEGDWCGNHLGLGRDLSAIGVQELAETWKLHLGQPFGFKPEGLAQPLPGSQDPGVRWR
jgi:hypothetical protein